MEIIRGAEAALDRLRGYCTTCSECEPVVPGSGVTTTRPLIEPPELLPDRKTSQRIW